ncbi:MAG: DUF4175 domain-containing protein [Alphaproteobacteria bacterium]
MLDLHDYEHRPFASALIKKRRRALFTLTVEQIILHGWRAFFWCLLFFGLWMLNLPDFFGFYARCFTTVVFLGGIIYFLKKDILSFTFPSKRKIDYSIEQTSSFPRGHIALLKDTLANPKAHETRTLWEHAQKTVLHSLKKLKSPSLKAQLSREDPSALRFLAILFFICGLIISGPQWKSRILSGLVPYSPALVLSGGQDTFLWITPPDYTQIPQVQVTGDNNKKPFSIPEGSAIRIRLGSTYGDWFPPYLHNGAKTLRLESLGDNLYGIETTIQDGKTLSVRQAWWPRERWNYEYIKDKPPEIHADIIVSKRDEILNNIEDVEIISGLPDEDTETPEPQNEEETSEKNATDDEEDVAEAPPPFEIMENLALRFALIVKDDYSVKELRMTMNIDELVEDRPLGDPATETRLVMSQPNDAFKLSPIYDLTWHTWAGLPVAFTYEAIDHKGQVARLDKITMVLPEREFEHPMAKSLITMRKRLAWDYQDSFFDISRHLETLLDAPDFFQNNTTIYLAIRSASSRLLHNYGVEEERKVKAAKEVIALLWEAALVIEDGNLSLAMRELQDAQQALENAMRDPNASDEEIAELMQELREKMSNYFTELQRDMQKRIESGELQTLPSDQFDQIISPDMLSQMMEQLEQALRDGDEQTAQELMSQMQRMMEMMDPSMQMALPMDMEMMKEGINELQELIERQEALLEQTKEQVSTLQEQPPRKKRQAPAIPSANNSPDLEEMLKDFGFDVAPPSPEPQKKEEKNEQSQTESQVQDEAAQTDISNSQTEQAALRYILGQLMLDAAEKLDDVPEKMGMAEQEMRLSEQSLGDNAPNRSIPHQELAIQHLKEAQEDLAQQFRSRMQQMIGISMSGRPNGGNRDPLGRPFSDQNDPNGKPHGSDIQVPDETEKKRVDEILKMLRDRSGDRSRSRDELDYFRRLLRQF